MSDASASFLYYSAASPPPRTNALSLPVSVIEPDAKAPRPRSGKQCAPAYEWAALLDPAAGSHASFPESKSGQPMTDEMNEENTSYSPARVASISVPSSEEELARPDPVESDPLKLKTLKAFGMTCTQAKAAEYTLEQVIEAGYLPNEILCAGFRIRGDRIAHLLPDLTALHISLLDVSAVIDATSTSHSGVVALKCKPCEPDTAATPDRGAPPTLPSPALMAPALAAPILAAPILAAPTVPAHSCGSCARAKTACSGVVRPCPRCVRLGLPCTVPNEVKTIKRACEVCRTSKIKCDLGAPGSGACSRCAHLGLVCIPHEAKSAKRKRTTSAAGAAMQVAASLAAMSTAAPPMPKFAVVIATPA